MMNNEVYVWQAIQLPWEARFHKRFGINNTAVNRSVQESPPVVVRDNLTDQDCFVVKVGSTTNWWGRSSNLSTALPMGMTKILTVQTPQHRVLEDILHKHLSCYLAKGELFHIPTTKMAEVSQQMVYLARTLNPILARLEVYGRHQPPEGSVLVNDREAKVSIPLTSSVATPVQTECIELMRALKDEICQHTLELAIIKQRVGAYLTSLQENANPHGILVECPPLANVQAEMDAGEIAEWQQIEIDHCNSSTDNDSPVVKYQPGKRPRDDEQPVRTTLSKLALMRLIKEHYGMSPIQECLKVAPRPVLKVVGFSYDLSSATDIGKISAYKTLRQDLENQLEQPQNTEEYKTMSRHRLKIQGDRDRKLAQLEIAKLQLANSMINSGSELVDPASQRVLATFAWLGAFDKDTYRVNYPHEYEELLRKNSQEMQ